MTQRAELTEYMLKHQTVADKVRGMIRQFADHNKRQPLDWASVEIEINKTEYSGVPIVIYMAFNLL